MSKLPNAAFCAAFLSLCAPASEAQEAKHGWYAGGFLGYGTGESSWSSATVNTGDFTIDGMVAGLYGGHIWQRARTVYGVELEIAPSEIEGGTQRNCAGCRTDLDGYAFVKARLGRDTGSGLLYGTLGYGAAGVTHMLTGTGHASDITQGWQAGIGYEAPFQEGWNLRGEASYMRFDAVSQTLGGVTSVETGTYLVLKLGLTRKF